MLCLENVKKHFNLGWGRTLKAVDEVDVALEEGEIVGLMGESGCGKTTTGLLACKLLAPTAGRVLLDGRDVTYDVGSDLKAFRKAVQIVFQDPLSAFNPRRTIAWSLKEAGEVTDDRPEEWKKRQEGLCSSFDYSIDLMTRFPHELSGGELQRAAIVRSLLVCPRFLIVDEPTSMLDLSTQAQIARGLRQRSQDQDMGILWITHDEELAAAVCDRVLLMEHGKIVSERSPQNLLERKDATS